MGRYKSLLVVAALVAGAAVVFYFSSRRWHTVYCSAILPLVSWAPQASGLRSCSNIVQSIEPDSLDNIGSEAQEGQPGWLALTCKDKARTGRFRLKVLRDRAWMLYYPRANGTDSGVEVFVKKDGQVRKLSGMTGSGAGWSDIGAQHGVNIGCVFDGDRAESFTVELEFVLRGPSAQVWAKDGAVVF
ncbi:MAG: hypothetical protein ACP59X_02785 [Solidesulfovibrio sp. DCME]|uniref:hypothetical protein n=1 Tax=Solidesulfovibrio sp. DCME TaxID=3447380 RepID=UPI003D0CCBCC